MVKIGDGEHVTSAEMPKLNENKGEFINFADIWEKFTDFVEIGGNIQYASLT